MTDQTATLTQDGDVSIITLDDGKANVFSTNMSNTINSLLDSVPDIDNLFEVKSVEDVQALLDGYLSSDSSAESSSSETQRFKKKDSNVDAAFAAFMQED